MAAPFGINDPNLLEQMVAPSTCFFTCIFRKKALCIHNDPSRVANIITAMHNLDTTAILNDTSSDHVFIWLKQPDGKISSLEIQDVDQAIALHNVGHATYCRAPPSVEQPLVYNMLRGTGLGCGTYDPTGTSSTSLGRGEVEVFIGTNNHTTDWHYDFQENFTLQLSGSKRWTLQSSTIKYPLRGCTPHYASPDTVESQLKAAHLSHPSFQFGTPDSTNSVGPTETVTLTPGDMLYFPAGMWHRVETVEPGVSINISLMATNYAAVTAQAIQQLLLRDNAWRETIVSGPTSTGGTALVHLEMLLKGLPAKLEAFAQQHGAAAILPPVLRHPPKLEFAKENDEWNEVEEEDDDDQEEQQDQDEEQKSDDDMNDDDKEMDLKLSNMFGCQVVDVLSFERPEGWCDVTQGASAYIRNPLAHLVSIGQVSNYYNPQNGVDNKYWLLNVNYAGNEMHESSVRVILKDESDPLLLGMMIPPAQTVHKKLECYLYYGLYIAQST